MAHASDGRGLREHVREYHVPAGYGWAFWVQAGGGAVSDGAAGDAWHDEDGDAETNGDRKMEPVPGGAVRGSYQHPRKGGWGRAQQYFSMSA